METEIVLLIVLIVFAMLIVIFSLVGRELFRKTLKRGGFFDQVNPEFDQKKDEYWKDQSYEQWTLTSHDDLQLIAHYYPLQTASNKIAILAHGYGCRGTNMISLAKMYQEIGYHVLLPDDRGHGDSEGEYIGMGWLDRLDYVQWMEQVINKLGEDCEIVLHGISMGGATVCALAGEPLPKQVRSIISDCAYDSVDSIFRYQLKKQIHLPAFPVIYIASLLCILKLGYWFREADMKACLLNNEIPIFFIHGAEDHFVPTDMVHELYYATMGKKELWIVPEAEHGQSFFIAEEEYREKVQDWLEKCKQKRWHSWS